jgi:hypothetical protein
MSDTDAELDGLDVQISGPKDTNGNLKVVVTFDDRILSALPLIDYPLQRPCPLCGLASHAVPYPNVEIPDGDVEIEGPADKDGNVTVLVTLTSETAVPGTYQLARPCPLCGIGQPPTSD